MSYIEAMAGLSQPETGQLSDPHREYLRQRNLEKIRAVSSGELTPEQFADELTDQEIKLEHRADHDGLTGLLNYLGFVDTVTGVLNMIQQNDIPAYLAFLDIDKLKDFNDTKGKIAGNKLIQTYANVLNTAAATEQRAHLTFIIARFGGDECVMLVIGAGEEEMLSLTEDVRKNLPEAVRKAFNDPSLDKTVSIGVTRVRPDDNVLSLLERGDTRLKEAKLQRNSVVAE